MSTYQQLKELIVAQGIVHASAIHLNSSLIDDLSYDHNDVAELARMAEQVFQVQIEPDEYESFINVRDVVLLVNAKRAGQSLTEFYSDYSSLG